MSEWFSDGEAITTIAVEDRAAHYGDGLFETLAIRDGAARLWPYHVDRLQLGCERLGIAAPAADALDRLLQTALAETRLDLRYATAKLVVAAAAGPRGYRRAPGAPVARIGLYAARPYAADSYQSGVRTRLCSTRLAVQPQLAGIKSLNRLEQVLARAEWDDAAVFEGLTLDTGGRLICGTMSNVFLALDNRLATPALTRCGVAGVMRRHVLTELERGGIEVDVRDIDGAELAAADEMFLTNSQFGVLPVAEMDGRSLQRGEMTANVMQVCAASGIEECGV